MTQMTARYPGTCAATGNKFRRGDIIDYDRKTKKTTLVRVVVPAGGSLMKSYRNTDRAIDRGESRYVSDVFRTSGGEFYRNKNGRCEDAPCCGCCTI